MARLVERVDLPAGADVLDVGCGTGLLALLLASRYASYTGVDFSEAMVRVARERAGAKRLHRCEFIEGDAVALMSRQVGTYDAIFMFDISEHVPDAEWAAVVKAARQSLKPSGKVYLHTPNLDFLIERMKQNGWMKQFPEHVAVRDGDANKKFFQDAGYSSVVCDVLPHYNVLRWLHFLANLPVVGKYMAARLWIVAMK